MNLIKPRTRMSFWLILLTFLVSCSGGTQRYEVGGKHLCVPNPLVVTAPFSPSGPTSFAFQGCSESSDISSAACPLPFLVSGSVSASRAPSISKLSDFPHGAFYRQIALSPDSHEINSGRVVVIQNVQLSPRWFVWTRKSTVSPERGRRLAESDQLEATCASGLANPSIQESTLDSVVCHRRVLRDGLLVGYSFQSDTNIPTDFTGLDQKVFATLGSWQCD